MKEIVSYSAILLSILAYSALFAAEPPEIKSIREYYSETLKKIKAGSLYKREMNVANPVIPGIGRTSSRMIIYYEILAGQDGQYEYNVIRVENYYQYAAAAFYEEFLFSGNGNLRFYFGRRGSGDIGRPDAIRWEYDERFYFRDESLVLAAYGGDSSARSFDGDQDRPYDASTSSAHRRAQGGLSSEDIKKGAVRLGLAKRIREQDCAIRIATPALADAE